MKLEVPPVGFELSGDLNELSNGVSSFWVVSLVQKDSIVYIFSYGIFTSCWQKSLLQSIFLMQKILHREKKRKVGKFAILALRMCKKCYCFPFSPGSLSACWSQWETMVSLFTFRCISFTEEKKNEEPKMRQLFFRHLKVFWNMWV